VPSLLFFIGHGWGAFGGWRNGTPLMVLVTYNQHTPRWHKDVIVDLVGFRRNGHNELDDATATLPLTCAAIESHYPVLDIYARKLEVGVAV
jgi:hypothetical protein